MRTRQLMELNPQVKWAVGSDNCTWYKLPLGQKQLNEQLILHTQPQQAPEVLKPGNGFSKDVLIDALNKCCERIAYLEGELDEANERCRQFSELQKRDTVKATLSERARKFLTSVGRNDG